MPLARPNKQVEKRLVIAYVSPCAVQFHPFGRHAAEVVGRAEQVDSPLGCGSDVLLDGRVGMARGDGVGVDIATVLKHGAPFGGRTRP